MYFEGGRGVAQKQTRANKGGGWGGSKLRNLEQTYFLNVPKTSPWVKKGNNSLFDVTMGSYDGADIGELAGLYLLNHLSIVINKSGAGLYRDDGPC